MKNTGSFICGATLSYFLLFSTAVAEETKGWGGEASLNGSVTTGNNETSNLGFGLKVNNRGSDWRHNFQASTDYGRNNGNTNKRRYRLGYKIGRDIAERVYSFANADYYSDDFGAYKHGYFLGLGLGYSALIDDPTHWRIEGGAGYRSQKARLNNNNPLGLTSLDENFLSARLFSEFKHEFNESVNFSNDTEILYSEIDTFFINETGLTSNIFESLAVRATFRIETHTEVPPGREKTDTISRVGIVYKMN